MSHSNPIDVGQPLQAGRLALRNRLALAPMAGLTDVPFRTQAWRMGAGYMVSEMVGSKPQLWDTGKSRLRRVAVPGVDVNAVQIAGVEPEVMAAAARSHVDQGAQVVDLNFGCPAKKVYRKAAGSALLAEPANVGRIVEAVTRAVDVPVTVKTRLGLTPDDNLGLQAAVAAEKAGAAMLVIHARSRACRFTGPVNYAAVRSIKQAVSVPVLVNGDIGDVPTLNRALSESQADGVMIGRHAIGQPWLFSRLLGRQVPGVYEQWQSMLDQLQHSHEFYGEITGVRIMRKHVRAFLEMQQRQDKVQAFMALETATSQIEYLCRLREVAEQAA